MQTNALRLTICSYPKKQAVFVKWIWFFYSFIRLVWISVFYSHNSKSSKSLVIFPLKNRILISRKVYLIVFNLVILLAKPTVFSIIICIIFSVLPSAYESENIITLEPGEKLQIFELNGWKNQKNKILHAKWPKNRRICDQKRTRGSRSFKCFVNQQYVGNFENYTFEQIKNESLWKKNKKITQLLKKKTVQEKLCFFSQTYWLYWDDFIPRSCEKQWFWRLREKNFDFLSKFYRKCTLLHQFFFANC